MTFEHPEFNSQQALPSFTGEVNIVNLFSPLEKSRLIQEAITPDPSIFTVLPLTDLGTSLTLAVGAVQPIQNFSGDLPSQAGTDPLLGNTPFLTGYSSEMDGLLNHNTSVALKREIVFVDAAVEDYQAFVAHASNGAEVIRLEHDRDGVEQIGTVLAQRQDISAVHIVAHGNDGSIQLGNTILSSDTLSQYTQTLQNWGKAFTQDGDILLYGCDVAADEAGKDFVQSIASLTGTDVAASDDLTGNAALGGDWDLEYQQGAIEAQGLIATNFEQVLAATVSFSNGALLYQSNDSTDNVIKIYTSGNFLAIEDSTGISVGSGVSVDSLNPNKALVQTSAISSLGINAGSGNDSITISSYLNLSGSVSIQGGGGSDSFTVADGVVFYTQGKDLTVDADTIKVGDSATISTVLANGNAGSISFTGQSITVGDDDGDGLGASILAQASGNYSSGAITFSVSENEDFDLLEEIDTINTGIDINQSTIKGGTLSFSAYGNGGSIYQDGNSLPLLNYAGHLLMDALDDASIYAGVAKSKVTATIDISSGSTIAATTLTASATALGEATARPLSLGGVGVAYARLDTTATITINGSVTTTGDLNLGTKTDNTIDARADASGLVGVAGTAAISELYSTSEVNLGNGAVISVGGDLTVKASTIDRNYTLSRSTAGQDGLLGLAVAVSLEEGNTNALVDSSQVEVTGNITIDATQEKEKISSSKFFGILPNTVSGVSAQAGANTTSTGDLVDDAQGASVTKILEATGLATVFGKLGSKLSKALGFGGEGSWPVGIAAAVAYVQDTNNVTARIGDNAGVKSSTGNITIDAEINNRPDVTAASRVKEKTVQPTETNANPSAIAISPAVAIGDYTNDAKAYIGKSATVNAYQDLSITSQALNDYSSTYGVNLYDAVAQEADYQKDDGRVTIASGDIVEADGEWYQYIGNFGGTVINLSSQNYDDATTWKSLGTAWLYKTKQFFSNLTTYLNNNLGLDNNVFDSWSQSTAAGTDNWGVAGAATYLSLNHTSQAFIDEGAQINQDTTLRSGNQTVSVQAISVNQTVNFGGNIEILGGLGLEGNTGSDYTTTYQLDVNGSDSFKGSQGESAIGASILVVDYTNNTYATINSGVKLYADSLKVDADSDTSSIAIAASGGSAEEFGFNGTFPVIFVDNETKARIDDGVQFTIGDNLIAGTTASLVIEAKDNTELITIAGGVAASDSIGVGVSASYNGVERTTEAFIGDINGADASDTDAWINAGGNVDIHANNTGDIKAFSLAAAVSTGTDNATDFTMTDVGSGKTSVVSMSDEATEPSWGVGASGDVSLNDVDDTTRAYIANIKINAAQNSITLSALADTEILSISGSVAVSLRKQDTKGSVGLAGSYSQNTVSNDTAAYVDNATLSLGILTIDAENEDDILAINASGSGSVKSPGSNTSTTKTTALAGSVAINEVVNSTLAYINASTINGQNEADNSIKITAENDTTIIAVAGALQYGGSLGIGASIAVNVIGAQIIGDNEDATKAYINNSKVYTDDLTLSATNNSTIYSFAAAAGASTEGMAVEFSLTLNEIKMTTAAAILDDNTTDNVSTTIDIGSATLLARDTADILSVAGVLSASIDIGSDPDSSGSNGATLGVGIGLNTIKNDTSAYLDEVSLTATSTIELGAIEDATIESYAVGGAVSVASNIKGNSLSLAGTGAGTDNTVENKTKVYVQNSQITTDGQLAMQATDVSNIHGDAGGVAIALAKAASSGTSTSLAVGAGVAVNNITNTVEAYVSKATLDTGSATVVAYSSSTIDAFAIGGSVAGSSTSQGGTSLSLSGAGAGTYNDIDNTIAAYISGASTVTTTGGVTVSATDDSKITADSGGYAIAAALGSSGSNTSLSVGVATADNNISNKVKAYIDNATVDAGGEVYLQALSTSTIDALGIGGTAAVSSSSGSNISLSGAGAGVTNTINNTITAIIQNGSTVTNKYGRDISIVALDSSKITSDAGGVAIALGLGSTSFGVSVGASVSTNKIGNVGHTVKAAIDNSTVTASGNLRLDATSNATIDALAFSGAAAGSGGSGAGLSFTGTAAISDNSIKSTIQAVIQNVGGSKSVKTTTGSIQLNALDNSEITSDAGGAALALSFGSGGAAGLSVGFSVATNTTTNTTQAFISAATVSAKTTLDLSAKSTSFIDTFALGGAAAGSAGSGGGIALSGAGAGSYSTMTNTTEAAILFGSDVDAGGALTIKADDTSDRANGKKLDTLAVGGSAAVSGGAGGSGAIAVSAVVVDNTLNNKVRAYIGLDGVTADTTTVDAASLSLTVTSNPIIESEAVAVSVAAAFSRVGAALAGGGANVTNTLTNTIAALIQGGSTVTATTGSISLTATDTPHITGGIGSGALSIGVISASIAISLTDTIIDNTVTAAIESAKVTANNGNITLDADSTPTIDNTVVATSVSAGLGGAVAGGDGAGTVSSDVAAYVGDKATINTQTLNVWADSNSSVTNEVYGVGAAIAAAIGVSTAESTVNGSTKAYVGSNATYVTGTTVNATGINVTAKATGSATTSTTAIAGGIVASGSGNDATSTFSPTVEAFIGNSTTLNVTGDVSVTATAQPKADADSFGVSAAVGVAMGFSFASAKIDPTVNAFVGQNSKVTAKNLTLLAQQILPGSGYSTEADSSGSGGALLGAYNSSDSDAVNYGDVSAYVGNSSTLTITHSASITANAKSTQNAYADGYNGGILAGGFNPAYAATNITTQSYIGSGVTINTGSFTLKAIGDSDNFADAKSGGGGLISGRASSAETKDISTTKVYLNYDSTKADNTNNSTTTINANSVVITADNTTTFNSRADSINASIVGGSGALATNTIDADVEVNLGSKVNVTTQNLVVNANNTIDKSVLNDQNVEAGSGGIVDGSAVVAKTTITNQTNIIVGDNTILKVTGDATNPGDFSLTVTNNVAADEDAKIETGGLVPVAGADATIQNNTNIAQIQIGNADLISVGDIDLATVSAATLDTYAKAKVWGLAGGPIGTTLTELNATNAIVLLNGAYLESEGDVNLEAGKDADIVQEDINLNAYT